MSKPFVLSASKTETKCKISKKKMVLDSLDFFFIEFCSNTTYMGAFTSCCACCTGALMRNFSQLCSHRDVTRCLGKPDTKQTHTETKGPIPMAFTGVQINGRDWWDIGSVGVSHPA